MLFLNGVMLYGAEILKKKKQKQIQNNLAGISFPEENLDLAISHISWLDSIKIGCTQALALIPGFSRSGATLAGGLLTGLDHESAARFSFLLATPIIFAAGILKLPDLLLPNQVYPFDTTIGPIIAGSLSAGLGAYVSVSFLTRYFKTKTLTPFAIYCMLAGIITSCLFLFFFHS